MINEANEPSSACRLWRISQVETSTPPASNHSINKTEPAVKQAQSVQSSPVSQVSHRTESIGNKTNDKANKIPLTLPTLLCPDALTFIRFSSSAPARSSSARPANST